MGILDKAKEMLGLDEATDAVSDAANKAGEAAKSKVDQVTGKATDVSGDAAGGLKDKAKNAVDSVKESAKGVVPDSMDEHVEKGAKAVKEGIDKIGS